MEETKGDFKREYLWELSIPRVQLLALTNAVPEDQYGWKPAEDARTFSAVLVHIAAGNMMLLWRGYGRGVGEGSEFLWRADDTAQTVSADAGPFARTYGQAIAYVRSMGMKAPWPDPLKNLDRIVAGKKAE